MFDAREVEQAAFGSLRAGDVLIVRDGPGDSKLAVVLAGDDGHHRTHELTLEGGRSELEKDGTFLRLTVPLAIRFDPFSATGAGERWPPSGTLLFVDGSPAIFDRGNPSTGKGSAVKFDGHHGALFLSEAIPAFTRWTVGIDRDNGFCELLTFSVDPHDTTA